jgi:hypothetical protein
VGHDGQGREEREREKRKMLQGERSEASLSLWQLVLWWREPIKTIADARNLIRVGVICFSILAILCVIFSFALVIAAGGRPTANLQLSIVVFVGVALLYGACALGTYHEYRSAAVIGFALIAPFIIYVIPTKA